jgi:hypothetical protein
MRLLFSENQAHASPVLWDESRWTEYYVWLVANAGPVWHTWDYDDNHFYFLDEHVALMFTLRFS